MSEDELTIGAIVLAVNDTGATGLLELTGSFQ